MEEIVLAAEGEGVVSVGVCEAGDLRTAARSPFSGSAEC